MTNAIANQLQPLVNSGLELLELSNAHPYWQKQLKQAIINPISPIYLVFPETVEILAEIVKQAQQHQWRILICGNGSKLDWGGLTKDIQLVVSTQKCDRIIEHAVGDLTVTVEAGIKLAELQTQLRSHGQFLPIDPAYPQAATIGGIVATADTGSWRQRYGGIRDLLLGLSFVRADGEIAKAGGRVVKNVAGYDLMKLFTGAYGTLGIITQVTLRTYPLVATSQTIVLTGNADDLAQATQTIRNSSLTPTAMDLLSASVVEQLELNTGKAALIIRFQTIPQSIKQQIEQVQAIAQQLNLSVTHHQDSDESNLWQKLAEIIRIGRTDTAIIAKIIISKIGIAPAAAATFLQSKPVIASNSWVIIHAASGLGQIQLESQDVTNLIEIITQMRSLCQQNQGFLTILEAPQAVKQQLDVWGYTGNALKTMQTIKHKFDPKQILNPGRFVV